MGAQRLLCMILLSGVTACAAPPSAVSSRPPSEPPPTREVVFTQADIAPMRARVGKASWYGALHHGRRTASGEAFDMNALTAAHRTLPLGTRVRVTNLWNGKAVEVRVNDRGPGIRDRLIDLSRRAAATLDAIDAGVFPVEVVVLD